MKKIIPLLAVFIIYQNSLSQETISLDDSRVITTGVPFMLVAPDARSAGMGDMGVATSVDGFSQQYNPAKYAFSEAKSGVSLSYTPYLSRLVNDISIAYGTYFNRLNDFSAISASIKYFSLGEINLTQQENPRPGEEIVFIPVQPNEYSIDVAYALKLSERFSMAVAMRYFRSALRIGEAGDNTANPASSFGADITGYYQSEEIAYNDFNGRWRAGFAIQNLGPRFSYDDEGQDTFQPSNLRLGGGFDFIFDYNNTLALTAEVTKLLVPTPPELGYVDTDGDGQQDSDEPTIILNGQDNDVGFLQGVFQSFGDAPGGFSEELQEFTWSLGAEYRYQDAFALRAGYFNEAEEKGARQFFALGAGFKYSTVSIDLSYLFSASRVQSPLENTLRFSLTFNFGDGEYSEF